MPSMFMFSRKRMKPELLDEAPIGSREEWHESGWIQCHFFMLWLKRFIEWERVTKEKSVLLFLDEFSTYVKTMKLIGLFSTAL